MSKIRSAFENGKAFIPFITCGDPNLETTAKIVREAVANGADLIELGIPPCERSEKRCHNSYGFHDICKRGLLLRRRKVYQYM